MMSVTVSARRLFLLAQYLLFVLAVQPLAAWQGASFNAATIADRGQRPAGSYRIEELETINEVNGGIGFSIPLAQFPKGRAGMAFQLSLVYNSALYDTQVQMAIANNSGIDPPPTVPTAKMITSPNGGWRYAFGYGLEEEYRLFQGSCNAEMVKSYKLRLRMPDGSAKLLRLGGYQDLAGNRHGGGADFQDISGDGFYQYHPNGTPSLCTTGARLQGKMVYYTDDGSYIRVETDTGSIPLPLGSVSWTVFLPDGSRAIGVGGGTTDLFDRNENQIRIRNVTIRGEGVPVTRFTDDAGREIDVVHDTGRLGDTVRYKGFNGTSMSVSINRGSVNVGPRTYQCNAFHEQCRDYFNLRTITQLVRRNESTGEALETFSFGYSACPFCGGEVNAVNLPSGARIEYSYAFDGKPDWPSGVYLNPVAQKRVIYNESADGQTVPVMETANYCFEGRGNSCLSAAYGRSSIVGPDGGRTTNYFSDPLAGSTIYKVERPDGSVIERQWSFNRPFAAPTNVAINPYVRLEVTTLPNAAGSPARAKARRFTLDRNGNQIQIEEFGWANYSPTLGAAIPLTALPREFNGLLLRSTTTSFFRSAGPAVDGAVPDSSNAYSYPNAPRAQHSPASRHVSDASGAVRAYVAYEYDGGPAEPIRGNVTKERQWDSTKGNNFTAHVITRSWGYDQWGNVITETDPRGGVTRTEYDITRTSWVSRTIADGQALQRATTRKFDFSTDLTTEVVDVRNNITSTMSYDARGRILLVREAAGPNERRVRTAYDDVLRRITEFADLNAAGDEQRVTVRHYDPLYRLRLERWIENRATENPEVETTGIKRQYRYRFDSSAGSYRLVSNSFRAATSNLAGSETTMGWSRDFVDRAGRPRRTDFFAGAALPAPWGNPPNSSIGATRTDYDGEKSTIWDEADKVRSLRSDALGRLDQVIEGNMFTTNYSYDALDNLTRVEQGVQVRSFDYTSLSRLRSATQPEFSGAVQYGYDDNGNLIRREDPRGVVTNWDAYDALQRPTRKTYTDGTPGVTYTYDQGPNAFGRLTSIATANSTTTYSGYDPLGRIGSSSQVTNGASYNFSYTYDLADNVRSLMLPTGRILSYGVDAAGRTATVSGLFAWQPRTYLSQITYAPNGASRQWQLGNGLWTGVGFNSRQQVSGVTVGGAPGIGSLLSLGLTWSSNGNLETQTVIVPGATRTQTFGYDAWNRLQRAEEVSGGVVWRQAFQFDQYGNRWQSETVGFPLDPLTPLTQNFFVATTNRLQGGSYDAAGNQLVVNPYTLTYDAENRPRTVRMTVGAQTFDRAAYTYDGEGRRVRRVETFMNGPATETVFVYDAFGRLGVEYGGGASQAGTRYLSTDHLGSTRLVSSETGAVISRRDLTPFGEVIPAGTGGRGGEFGAPAGTSILFTGKERDVETGLDYFGARYMSAAQGRFTSPDAPFADQDPVNPQSWNLYSYGRNNPLLYVDPTGNYVCASSVSTEQCDSFQQSLDQAQTAANALKEKYGADSKQYTDAQAAISSYGTRGKDNGVTIAIGDTGKNGAITTVANSAGAITGDNKNGQNITVTFNAATIGNTTLAAHEGSHVADGSAYVSSGFNQALNPTNRQTETKAFQVQSNIGIGMSWQFQTVTFGGHAPYLLNVTGWPQANTDNMINAILNQQYRNLDQKAFPLPAPRRRR
ncbi:MAG: RHS repeat domain-containing protein [Acidobacteriota bacterium]